MDSGNVAEVPIPGNRDAAATADERARRRHIFGQQLRRLREQTGLTQEAVALLAGIDRSFYVQLEGGKRTISVERLDDLATALSVDVRAMFPPLPRD